MVISDNLSSYTRYRWKARLADIPNPEAHGRSLLGIGSHSKNLKIIAEEILPHDRTRRINCGTFAPGSQSHHGHDRPGHRTVRSESGLGTQRYPSFSANFFAEFIVTTGRAPRILCHPFHFPDCYPERIFSKEMHGEMIRFVVRRLCFRTTRATILVANE